MLFYYYATLKWQIGRIKIYFPPQECATYLENLRFFCVCDMSQMSMESCFFGGESGAIVLVYKWYRKYHEGMLFKLIILEIYYLEKFALLSYVVYEWWQFFIGCLALSRDCSHITSLFFPFF